MYRQTTIGTKVYEREITIEKFSELLLQILYLKEDGEDITVDRIYENGKKFIKVTRVIDELETVVTYFERIA